jgi:hypothetical protein
LLEGGVAVESIKYKRKPIILADVELLLKPGATELISGSPECGK